MQNQSNDSNTSNTQNANSVTPIQGVNGATASSQNDQQLDAVSQLAVELIRTLQQKSGDAQNSQFPSSISTRNANGNTTAYRNSRENTSSDYDYFEVEQQLIKEVQQIRLNADSYGDVVEIVGRRAVLAKSDDNGGRGNRYQFEYLLSDGRIMSNDECWELANAGKIKNVIGSHNHEHKYIRSIGDGVSDNNLGNLPTF